MGLTVNHALIRRIQGDVVDEGRRLQKVARAAVREATIAGMRTTQIGLLSAVTYTGEQRELMTGGNPGRYRSGQLYDDLGFYASRDIDSDEGAWFGWPTEVESYEYAAAQDAGKYGATFVDDEQGPTGGRYATPRIPPAGALWEGAIVARERLREILLSVGFKPTGVDG